MLIPSTKPMGCSIFWELVVARNGDMAAFSFDVYWLEDDPFPSVRF
jgi:hypothetical protein